MQDRWGDNQLDFEKTRYAFMPSSIVKICHIELGDDDFYPVFHSYPGENSVINSPFATPNTKSQPNLMVFSENLAETQRMVA
jgi:hypothetical protein